MKGMHQGSVTRVSGQTKYSVKDTHIDDIEGPGSLPPIMGVMGNNKSQQSYKHQTLDKKSGTKRKKRLKSFESKHVYNVSSYAQGNTSRNYVGAGILTQQGSNQNKSSSHFSFSSQSKSGHMHVPCSNPGRQPHLQARFKKKA